VQAAPFALLLLCAAAFGQPVTPSPAEATETKTVQELLLSTDSAKLAWGAYLAGNYRVTAFSADLLRLATSKDWRVSMAATDSLIRLKIDVPDETLKEMAEYRLDEVLIVISRNPGRYDQLVQHLLTSQLQDHYWVALNSILAAKPRPGFAALLLREWTLSLMVSVYDPNVAREVGCGGGGWAAPGRNLQAPGYPPLEAYVVSENPQPGDVLLAAGPHPVGYHKQSPNSLVGGTSIDPDDYRRDYLFYMTHLPHSGDDPMSTKWTVVDIEWKGQASYRAESRQLLQKIRRMVATLKKSLVDRHYLTLAESERINPTLKVSVVDRRKRRVPPLPEVSWALTENENHK